MDLTRTLFLKSHPFNYLSELKKRDINQNLDTLNKGVPMRAIFSNPAG